MLPLLHGCLNIPDIKIVIRKQMSILNLSSKFQKLSRGRTEHGEDKSAQDNTEVYFLIVSP
jgi:hypothetical protein